MAKILIDTAVFDLANAAMPENMALTIQLQHGKNAPSTTKPFSAPLAAPIKLREI